MKLIIRLYRQHDLDLIALHRDDEFCFSVAVRRAIHAYVNKEQLSILAPGPKVLPKEKIPKQIHLIVKFDEKKDMELINWLKSIKSGYRNSCVKNLLRGYLVYPVMYSYMEDIESYVDVEDNNEIFMKNTKNYEKMPGRLNLIKKKRKNTPVAPEDSIANEILGNKKKEKAVYVENVEKDVDTKKLADDILKKEQEETLSEEENDEMFDTFENMLKSM